MAVRKGKTTGSVMVAGGIVYDLNGVGIVRITCHIDDEVTVIDAVFAFVHEYPSHGWTGIIHGRTGPVNSPPWAGIPPGGPANPVVHGHAANARNGLFFAAVKCGCIIGRAFPDTGTVATILPEKALLDEPIRIPIMRVVLGAGGVIKPMLIGGVPRFAGPTGNVHWCTLKGGAD